MAITITAMAIPAMSASPQDITAIMGTAVTGVAVATGMAVPAARRADGMARAARLAEARLVVARAVPADRRPAAASCRVVARRPARLREAASHMARPRLTATPSNQDCP